MKYLVGFDCLFNTICYRSPRNLVPQWRYLFFWSYWVCSHGKKAAKQYWIPRAESYHTSFDSDQVRIPIFSYDSVRKADGEWTGRSEGNLVNELDNGNPSKLLLAAIQKHDIRAHGSLKEEDFYLGAFCDDKVRTGSSHFKWFNPRGTWDSSTRCITSLLATPQEGLSHWNLTQHP